MYQILSIFTIGAINSPVDENGAARVGESVRTTYMWQSNLNTSFTGEDSLDVSLDGGNAGNQVSELDLNSTTSEALTVDGVSYTFPVMGATVFVGDNMDGSTLFSTACVYGLSLIHI